MILKVVSAMAVSILAGQLLAGAELAHAAGNTYYVSPSGNDSNSGLSASTPWRTIAKVNGFTFPRGSTVSFQGGQTHTGCLVFDSGNVPSSSASTPFMVTSYGTGVPTIKSNCTGDYSAAVTADNVSGFYLDKVKLVSGAATAAGVLLQNQESSSPTQTMVVRNSEITGFKMPSGSSSTFGGQIMVIGFAVNGNNGPMNNVKILNNQLHGATKNSADGPGVGGWGYGQNITNVLVQGNVIYNLGLKPQEVSSGILANGWDGAVIQRNKIRDIGGNVTSCGGTSGIQSYTSNNVTIRFNEVYRVEPYPSYTKGCDWVGIDLDGATTNSVVEYNYTHDNAGSGLMAYTGTVNGKLWGPNTFRYNISENDDWAKAQGGLFNIVPNAPRNALSIYGNTLFSNNDQRSSSSSSACFYLGYSAGTWASGSKIVDNICSMSNKDQYGRVGEMYYNPYRHTGMTLSHNLYYATASPRWRWGGTTYGSFAEWQSAGLETGPVWGDPLFTSAGNGGICTWTPASGAGPQPCPQAYTLKSGSPARGAGVPVANNGNRDYYQSTIPNPPHIGADAR